MSASETFITSLQRLEESRSVEPMVELFADNCSLARLTSKDAYEGKEGAGSFWREYLGMFKDIRSQFTNVVESGETAVLEWEAEGHLNNGEAIDYRGASVVEFAAGKVSRFRTYYDSVPFNKTVRT